MFKVFSTMKTKFNLHERNNDGGSTESDGGLEIFSQLGKRLRCDNPFNLDSTEFELAHFYILKNFSSK